MEAPLPPAIQPIHDEAERHHRRQMFWQVLLPIILSGLALALAVVWLVLNTTGAAPANTTLRDVSLVFILLPMLALFLVLMAATGALIYGLSRLYKAIPGFGGKALGFLDLVQGKMRTGADATVQPFIEVQQFFSRVAQVGTSFKQRIKRGKDL